MKPRIFFSFLALCILLFVNFSTTAQNYWEKTNGSFGGWGMKLLINSSDHIFAATEKGVYRSTDNGDNWMQINSGLKFDSNGTISITSISSDPKGCLYLGAIDGVFRSKNNGNHWTQVNNGLNFVSSMKGDLLVNDSTIILHSTFVSSMAINSVGHIYLGTYDGVYRSIDEGEHWSCINNGLNSTFVESMAIDSVGHIYSGTMDGLYVLKNNGNTWTKIINDKVADNTYMKCTLIAIDSIGHIFTEMVGGGQVVASEDDGVYRSTNNGKTWNRIIEIGGTQIMNFGGCHAFAIGPSGNIYIGTYEGVFYSTDNGDNWTQINKGLKSCSANGKLSICAIAISSKGNIYAGNYEGVIYRLK